jgi:hypothetical protein
METEINWTCWLMPVIPALGKLRQEDCKFEVSLVYIMRSCLKQTKTKKERKETNLYQI